MEREAAEKRKGKRKTVVEMNRRIYRLSEARSRLTAMDLQRNLEGQNGNNVSSKIARRFLHKCFVRKKPFASKVLRV